MGGNVSGIDLVRPLGCTHSCSDFRIILAMPCPQFHDILGSDYHSNFRHKFSLNLFYSIIYTILLSPGVIITGLAKVIHVPCPGEEDVVWE